MEKVEEAPPRSSKRAQLRRGGTLARRDYGFPSAAGTLFKATEPLHRLQSKPSDKIQQ